VQRESIIASQGSFKRPCTSPAMPCLEHWGIVRFQKRIVVIRVVILPASWVGKYIPAERRSLRVRNEPGIVTRHGKHPLHGLALFASAYAR